MFTGTLRSAGGCHSSRTAVAEMDEARRNRGISGAGSSDIKPMDGVTILNRILILYNYNSLEQSMSSL